MVWRTMLICLLVLMSVDFTGAQNNSQSTFFVRVKVAANDGMKGEAESYLKRELRSFGDVVISDFFGDYVLNVIITESTYKSSGTKTGQIDCAYLGIKRFQVSDVASKISKEQFVTIFGETEVFYFYPELFILATGGKRTELKQLCQEIVAEFDTALLEPDRQKR